MVVRGLSGEFFAWGDFCPNPHCKIVIFLHLWLLNKCHWHTREKNDLAERSFFPRKILPQNFVALLYFPFSEVFFWQDLGQNANKKCPDFVPKKSDTEKNLSCADPFMFFFISFSISVPGYLVTENFANGVNFCLCLSFSFLPFFDVGLSSAHGWI